LSKSTLLVLLKKVLAKFLKVKLDTSRYQKRYKALRKIFRRTSLL